MDRRRLQRPRVDTRKSLERALGTWQRLDQAWTSIFAAAQAVENWERMALADAKLTECQTEITRLEATLAER